MDDWITGAFDKEELREQKLVVESKLMEAKFPLHKFAANVKGIIEIEKDDDASNNESIYLQEGKDKVSVLGLGWFPNSDSFNVKIGLPENLMEKPMTKRQFLSNVTKTFDPLGLIAPVTVKAKILMQRIWQEELGWDDKLPLELMQDCTTYFKSLEALNGVEIRRKFAELSSKEEKENDWLVGFSDASIKAMCASVYFVYEGQRNLIYAKSKVAPLKLLTVPQLELEAALILAKLIDRVRKLLEMRLERVRCFSDSNIVLALLQKFPSNQGVFYRNRVKKINEILPSSAWAHVDTGENPADIGSRGADPEKLKKDSLWFKGPKYLENFNPNPIQVSGMVSLVMATTVHDSMDNVESSQKRRINH